MKVYFPYPVEVDVALWAEQHGLDKTDEAVRRDVVEFVKDLIDESDADASCA